MNGLRVATLFVVWLQAPVIAQNAPEQARAGTIISKVTCSTDPTEGYALHLPSHFSANHKWPILYVDPFARGQAAVEVVRAAAEKFGYIVAVVQQFQERANEHGTAPAIMRDA